MITIKAINGDYKRGFVVEGHSNFAENGEDIICASVSAITQTALLGLQNYSRIIFEQEDGYLYVRTTTFGEREEAIIVTMLMGLQEIQRQHPEYVKIYRRKDV